METDANLDPQFDKIIEKINEFNFSDIDILKQLYENSNLYKKKDIILNLETKLDYISNFNIKKDINKRNLLKDLIYCISCGLLPIDENQICLKCTMEKIGELFVDGMKNLAKYYFDKQNFEYSIFILKNLLKSDRIKELKDKYIHYYSIANAYNRLDKKEKELKYYLKSYEHIPAKRDSSAEGINNIAYEHSLYRKIGKLYFTLKDYDLALSYLKKIKNPKLDEILLKLESMVNLKKYLELYFVIKELPSFIKNDQPVLEIQEIVKNNLTLDEKDSIGKLEALLEKAEFSFTNEKFEDSLKYYEELLAFASQIGVNKYFKNLMEVTNLIQQKLAKKAIEIKAETTIRMEELKKGPEIENLDYNFPDTAPKKKKIKPPKIKGLLKKHMKGLTQTAGKMAGDMTGDKISELTGNPEIGQIAGKLASKGIEKLTEKGVEKLAEKGLEYAFKEGQQIKNPIKTSEEIFQSSILPLKVDLRERLLGIIKTKKKVKVEYIEKYLKLPREEIIGMIFDLIGKGEIFGEFNSDDSEFNLAENR